MEVNIQQQMETILDKISGLSDRTRWNIIRKTKISENECWLYGSTNRHITIFVNKCDFELLPRLVLGLSKYSTSIVSRKEECQNRNCWNPEHIDETTYEDTKINVLDRIRAKTRYEGDCWIFMGGLVGEKGYGRIYYDGKTVRLNRLVCFLYYGKNLNDNSWTANHRDNCISAACWNPEHIYPGTVKSNVQDSIRAGTFHYGTANLIGEKRKQK